MRELGASRKMNGRGGSGCVRAPDLRPRRERGNVELMFAREAIYGKAFPFSTAPYNEYLIKAPIEPLVCVLREFAKNAWGRRPRIKCKYWTLMAEAHFSSPRSLRQNGRSEKHELMMRATELCTPSHAIGRAHRREKDATGAAF